MSYLASSLQSTEIIGQDGIYGEFQHQSPHTASIHVLDDDSLLNMFYIYRPTIFDGDEDDIDQVTGGMGWDRERWWYKLAQVCQRWRNLILGSASFLRLCLVCKYGTPVEDMLAYSPPFPLIIDYFDSNREITVEDEEGILLALEQRDRIRRIRLNIPVSNLRKLIPAINDESPILEYLIMAPSTENETTALVLSETLQTPHLRHLLLFGFALPIGSQLLMTAVSLVTLTLTVRNPSAYFPPNILLRWLSFMPQLETLVVGFSFPTPNRHAERQLMHTPTMTHVTLPNLRWFEFQGVSTYLEAVVRQITTPHLEKLGLEFFKQLTFSVPRLLQFMNATENLKFSSAKFLFSYDGVYVGVSPPEADMSAFSMIVNCWHLDWQVSSVAQIFNSLSQIFSTVERLTLEYEVHRQSSEEHNEVERTEWHKLLRSFNNVKTLCVNDGLVKELSRSLRLEDGEHPLELLPELQKLTCPEGGNASYAFTSFIDARQNAGRPITLDTL